MKTQKDIRAKHDRIKEKIHKVTKELCDLQAECAHPNAVKINKADTGNWCPGDDKYWRDCKCPDCGKFWMEDQ